MTYIHMSYFTIIDTNVFFASMVAQQWKLVSILCRELLRR